MSDKCGFPRDRLMEYVYSGTEEAKDIAEIEAHIKGCAGCAEKAAGYKSAIKAYSEIKVDFSEDVWDIQRQEIIRKIRKERKDPFAAVLKVFSFVFGHKKLGFALLLVALAGVWAGHYRNQAALQRDRVMIEKVDVLENMEILERLDFYRDLAELGI
ncbi:MAG TPA: hypothetical protein ENN43_06490 [bacterium]|nr:hypothetical protein [bacterium]